MCRVSKNSCASRCTSPALTLSMLSTSSSRLKKRPKYSSWLARFAMRWEVDSRLSISDPFR